MEIHDTARPAAGQRPPLAASALPHRPLGPTDPQRERGQSVATQRDCRFRGQRPSATGPGTLNEANGPASWETMRKQPRHLPKDKQLELKHLVAVVRDYHRVEMIILFGSHARGDWVEDRYQEDYITYEYRSDFDILIVVKDKGVERALEYDPQLTKALDPGEHRTRINYIVHTIRYVNQMLSERRYFFMDILKEGYLLYDSGRYTLTRPPRTLPPTMMLRHAKEYFTEWLDSAEGFFESAQFNLSRQRIKIAIFELHQSAERFITCLLLVHTGYRPKEHDLEKLLRQAANFDPRFSQLFSMEEEHERHLFDLLRRAYVDARYSKRYRITPQEFDLIASRVQHLRDLTVEVCGKRIQRLKEKVRIKARQSGRLPASGH